MLKFIKNYQTSKYKNKQSNLKYKKKKVKLIIFKFLIRWKDEAEFLAEKFQTRYQELRLKSANLQKENEELNRELLSCRQQVAMCRARIMQR